MATQGQSLPSPVAEISPQQRFFHYFQHEITGKSSLSGTDDSLLTSLPYQPSKKKWIVSQTLLSLAANAQMPWTIASPASRDSPAKSKMLQDIYHPTTREHMLRYGTLGDREIGYKRLTPSTRPSKPFKKSSRNLASSTLQSQSSPSSRKAPLPSP